MPNHPDDGITYRWLDGSEYERLQPIFEEHGGTIPRPDMSSIVVAEDAGVIVGFIVVQLVAHVEPMWIDEAYRQQGVWRRMAAAVDEAFNRMPGTSYYAFTADRKLERMARKAGMTELAWKIWRKVF